MDCKKIVSVLWSQEEIREKKRRWIVGDPTLSVYSEKSLKKAKFLPESLLRSSQVIETFLGLRSVESHQVVQEYAHLFDPQTIENPIRFYKSMSFLLTNLKTQALNCVFDIVGEVKIDLERKKSPKNGFEKMILQIFRLMKSDTNNAIVKKLAAVLRDPINYRNHMKLTTLVNAQLISSIRKTVEAIDLMPLQALLAMKRKFDCVQVVPQIPVCIIGRQKLLLSELKKACDEALNLLKNGDELPEPFAKALSVVLLSIKLSSRKPDIQTSEFFTFNAEIVALQDEILNAIWTIPKVKTAELKILRSMLDPTSKLTLRAFRTGVVKYLTEFLFECSDIDIPNLLAEVLSFINRKSKRRLDFVKQISSKDELEHVMNISAQLKEIIWDNFPAHDVEQTLSDAGDFIDEYNSASDGDIIIDDEGCSGVGECDELDIPRSFTEMAEEVVGESEPADLLAARVSAQPSQAYKNGDACESLQDTIITGRSLSDRKSSCFQHGGLSAYDCLSIETVCDETAAIGYQIIDRVLEGLLGTQSRENITTNKHSKEDTKRIDILGSTGPTLLAQIIEELAPNFPKSGMKKMKTFMGQS